MCNNNRDLINQRVSWLVKIFTRVFVCFTRYSARRAFRILNLIFLGHGARLLAFLRQQDRVDVR
jgi:hypothetical protein